LFFWHYEQFPFTLIAMLTLLALLIAIYLRLDRSSPVSSAETWSVRVPFSIYLGWITVATVANVTDLLYYLNWDGFGLAPQVWMMIVLAAVQVISALMSLRQRDVAYNLVILWALIGIAVKFSAETTIVVATLITAALVAAVLIYSLFRKATPPASAQTALP
jgi:hypothetical protein